MDERLAASPPVPQGDLRGRIGFKLDLGDPNRFDSLGEQVATIYRTINYNNQRRIHYSAQATAALVQTTA